MNSNIKKVLSIVMMIVYIFSFVACSPFQTEEYKDSDIPQINESEESLDDLENQSNEAYETSNSSNDEIDEQGYYTSKAEVALFIHTYNKLPRNYITKKDAVSMGWEASEGNLWNVTDKMSIGGDRFGNREGKLPKKSGMEYFECDINYKGGFRGPERLVYSNDGLIYYTKDHYDSFELLYKEEWLW